MAFLTPTSARMSVLLHIVLISCNALWLSMPTHRVDKIALVSERTGEKRQLVSADAFARNGWGVSDGHKPVFLLFSKGRRESFNKRRACLQVRMLDKLKALMMIVVSARIVPMYCRTTVYQWWRSWRLTLRELELVSENKIKELLMVVS